jgi:2-dehydro-3-deoxygalactonokinase
LSEGGIVEQSRTHSLKANSGTWIAVDQGTTNTRVWLIGGGEVRATRRVPIGVRQTAQERSSAALHTALREAIAEVQADGIRQGWAERPVAVLAAGMITSPLGLIEVPHLPAPAGFRELAAGAVWRTFPDLTPLPFLLVPGVRSGSLESLREEIGSADVMRGEETLCLGLLATGRLAPGGTLLNLGSHWKVIRIDREGRIASSHTSLAGELIHVVQTQTLLAGSVPAERPTRLDLDWLASGMREASRAGLARALFCVRLLEQRLPESTPEERLAYLIGAVLGAELEALLGQGHLLTGQPVLLTGGAVLASAWRAALAQRGIRADLLSEEEGEVALRAGLQAILTKREDRPSLILPASGKGGAS